MHVLKQPCTQFLPIRAGRHNPEGSTCPHRWKAEGTLTAFCKVQNTIAALLPSSGEWPEHLLKGKFPVPEQFLNKKQALDNPKEWEFSLAFWHLHQKFIAINVHAE